MVCQLQPQGNGANVSQLELTSVLADPELVAVAMVSVDSYNSLSNLLGTCFVRSKVTKAHIRSV